MWSEWIALLHSVYSSQSQQQQPHFFVRFLNENDPESLEQSVFKVTDIHEIFTVSSALQDPFIV